MKILSVEFNNINSLAGRTRIDFTDPGFSPGVFLITGPTGSGKTSILDAITLGLFGRTGRQGSFTGGADGCNEAMNRDTGFCSSEVVFTGVDGHRYLARWAQARARNKVGGRLQAVRRSLVALDEGGRDLSEHTLRATDALISARLGFSFEEFTRTVILEQGQFDSFLKAKETDRGDILEKATRTAQFTRAGRAVFAAYQRAEAARKGAEDEWRRLAGEILEPEEEARIVSEVEASRKEREGLAAEEKGLADLRRWLEEDGRLRGEEEALARERARFEAGGAEARRLGGALARAKAARTADGVHGEAIVAAREVEGARGTIVRKEEEVLRREAQIPVLEARGRETARQLDEARGEKERVEPSIQRARELETGLRETRQAIAATRASLAEAERRRETLDRELGRAVARRRELEELKGFATTYQAGAVPVPSAFSGATIVRAIDAWRAGQAGLAAREAELVSLETEAKETAARLRQADADWPEVLRTHDERVRRAEQVVLQATLLASFRDHRAKLVEGRPCPLCGAREHPYALPGAHVEGIEEAERKRDEAIADRQAAQRRHDGLRDDTQRLRRRFDGARLALEGLRSEVSRAGDAVGRELVVIEERLAALTETISRRREELATAEGETAEKREAARGASEPLPALERARREIPFADPDGEARRLQASIDDRTARSAEADRLLREARQGLAAARAALAEARSNLAGKEGALREVRGRFEAAIGSMGFPDEGTWATARLDDGLFHGTEEAVARRAEEGAGLTAREASVREASEIHRGRRPELSLPLEEVVTRQGAVRGRLDEISSRIGSLRQQLERNRRDEERCGAAREALAAATAVFEKWKNLNKWLGGMDGRNFRVYAQGRTLERLLRAATPHLAAMSGNRYSFRWSPSAGTLTPRIVDHFLGDEVREVSNLSGGETFMVSLSLTLGLSRLSGDGFSVGSLFLDEGFGTLDESCLQLALSTLSKLHSEGCLVGIISHVEAVKEFIPARIEIRRTGPGGGAVSGPGVTTGPARP